MYIKYPVKIRADTEAEAVKKLAQLSKKWITKPDSISAPKKRIKKVIIYEFVVTFGMVKEGK